MDATPQDVPGAYQYAQLEPGETRMLCLRPGSFGSPLIADLEAFVPTAVRAPASTKDVLAKPLSTDVAPVVSRVQLMGSTEANAAALELSRLRDLALRVRSSLRAFDKIRF